MMSFPKPRRTNSSSRMLRLSSAGMPAAPQRLTCSPAPRRWKSASTSEHCRGLPCATCRRGARTTSSAPGSVDSHDEHYFAEPDGMIRGDVIDPRLTLDNLEITRRHVRAFLLQNYHRS